ncbi:hypothetical protein KC333_g7491 [Hortaea werneckii]|nr:hypothetical protein KC333_g7491 [Hortaea werneckii]KAI7308370.1 hypothetical protein KC326_g7417 [Hortaea werneckii]
MSESVLVVGSTGHIGISAVIAALRSKRNVLAVVRNASAAQKLFHHVGTSDGITTVEADAVSEHGVQSVVDRVEKGELPAFQHVYSAVGGLYTFTPLKDLSSADLDDNFRINFKANFLAYRATVPYLLTQSNSTSFTVITGAIGDAGWWPAPAMTQGALFSMGVSAELENRQTNVRFNEMYLAFTVAVDEEAGTGDGAKKTAVKASDFARAYEALLSRNEIKGKRVLLFSQEDIEQLRWEDKDWKGPR